MNAFILSVMPATPRVYPASGYLAGALIALAIFAYLIYTLVRPDKF